MDNRRKAKEGSGGREWEKGMGGTYLLQERIIDLFRRADFYCLHHFAGRNDNAAESFGRSRGHCA